MGPMVVDFNGRTSDLRFGGREVYQVMKFAKRFGFKSSFHETSSIHYTYNGLIKSPVLIDTNLPF